MCLTNGCRQIVTTDWFVLCRCSVFRWSRATWTYRTWTSTPASCVTRRLSRPSRSLPRSRTSTRAGTNCCPTWTSERSVFSFFHSVFQVSHICSFTNGHFCWEHPRTRNLVNKSTHSMVIRGHHYHFSIRVFFSLWKAQQCASLIFCAFFPF